MARADHLAVDPRALEATGRTLRATRGGSEPAIESGRTADPRLDDAIVDVLAAVARWTRFLHRASERWGDVAAAVGQAYADRERRAARSLVGAPSPDPGETASDR